MGCTQQPLVPMTSLLRSLLCLCPSFWRCKKHKENTRSGKVALFSQYRGKCTEDYARALHKINAPFTIIMTLRKLKTVFPSLRPPVEKMLKSGVVYRLTCPRCFACYVGETSRNLKFRVREYIQRAGPMKSHLSQCSTTITEENVDILQTFESTTYWHLKPFTSES